MPELATIRDLPLLTLVEESRDGVAVAAPGPWRIVYANRAFATWLALEPDQLANRLLEDVVASSSVDDLIEHLEFVWNGGESATTCVAQLAGADGACPPIEMRLSRLMIDSRPFVGLVAAGVWTEPRQVAETVTIRHDPLTGLSDRTFLMARMSALLQGDRSADQQFAVLFIDLDNFKQVNDQYGHLVGDCVLREVAQRLSRCVRAGDHLARFGGDEFVALLERVAGLAEIQPVIDRIHAALAEPINVPEGEITLSASVGVSEASPDQHSPEALLHEADRAMYALKRMHA